MARGILLDQGSNPCPLQWQAESYPLYQPGKSTGVFDLRHRFYTSFQILWGAKSHLHYRKEETPKYLGVIDTSNLRCLLGWLWRWGLEVQSSRIFFRTTWRRSRAFRMVATHTLQMECYLNSCYTYYLTYQCDVSLQSPTQAVSLIWFINIFSEGITVQSYSEFFSYSIKTGGPYCLYLNNIQLDYQSLTLQSEHQEYAKALTLTWCQELAFHSSKSTPRLIHSVLLEVNLIRGPCMEGFFHLWFLFGLGQWEALAGDWRWKG